jgi:hypothetical protein
MVGGSLFDIKLRKQNKYHIFYFIKHSQVSFICDFFLFRLTAASDKAYQLLAHGRWFSLGIPASLTTKTGRL